MCCGKSVQCMYRGMLAERQLKGHAGEWTYRQPALSFDRRWAGSYARDGTARLLTALR